jgi:hypothetical protein
MLEDNLRRALVINDGSLSFLWERPITLAFTLITLVMLLLPVWQWWQARRATGRHTAIRAELSWRIHQQKSADKALFIVKTRWGRPLRLAVTPLRPPDGAVFELGARQLLPPEIQIAARRGAAHPTRLPISSALALRVRAAAPAAG